MMPQGDLLIEDLTVAEFVELKSRMNQLKQADINGLLEMVELRESREQMVGSLYRPRIGLELSSDNIEQGAFTCPIISQQGNFVSFFYRKRHPL